MAAITARVMWLRESTAICYYPTRRRIDGVGSQQPLGQPRRPPSETKKARASFALARAAGSQALCGCLGPGRRSPGGFGSEVTGSIRKDHGRT